MLPEGRGLAFSRQSFVHSFDDLEEDDSSSNRTDYATNEGSDSNDDSRSHQSILIQCGTASERSTIVERWVAAQYEQPHH